MVPTPDFFFPPGFVGFFAFSHFGEERQRSGVREEEAGTGMWSVWWEYLSGLPLVFRTTWPRIVGHL
jgi:hypothetical protein